MSQNAKGVIGLLVIIFAIVIFFKINAPKKVEPVVLDFSEPTTYGQEIDTKELKLFRGDLISVIQNEGIVVVKAKIEPSSTNKLTIHQNYVNVANLIKDNGFNTCDELQYWAVADMTDGSESKVISFTLDKDTIDKIFNESIVDIQIGEYAADLWILPSLSDGI